MNFSKNIESNNKKGIFIYTHQAFPSVFIGFFDNLNAANTDSVCTTILSRVHCSDCREDRLNISNSEVPDFISATDLVFWVLALVCELLNLAEAGLFGWFSLWICMFVQIKLKLINWEGYI